MLFSWGELNFEAADIASYNEAGNPQYVEHALISRKPKLQCTGDNLRVLRIGIDIHFLQPNTVTAGSPQGFVERLSELAASHKPYPFTWGYGKYEGEFVAVALSLTREQTTADGQLMIASYSLTLREYVDNNKSTAAPAVKSTSTVSPSTSKATTSTTKVTGTAETSTIAATAAEVVRQA